MQIRRSIGHPMTLSMIDLLIVIYAKSLISARILPTF